MGLLDDVRRDILTVSGSELVKILAAALLVYIAMVALMRVGKSRFVGKNTALDVVLGFILGSTLSRAINGEAQFLPSVAAGALLIALHALVARIALDNPRFGALVKGRSDVIVREGRVDDRARRRHYLSQNDLEEAVLLGGAPDVEGVGFARFERNGRISVIPRRRPEVVEVDVHEGVQTVRIEIRT